MVTLIVAMDGEGRIGYQGGLPWDVPGDHCGRFVITREMQRALDIVVGDEE